MKNLQEATERICELKGSLVALDALVPAVIETMGTQARSNLMAAFDARAEAARTVLLHADISDVVLAAFERDVARNRSVLVGSTDDRAVADPGMPSGPGGVDAPLLATTRVRTFVGTRLLSGASGFLFRRGDSLFLVSSRHVFADPASLHEPDHIEIGVHGDPLQLTQHHAVSLPLYRDGVGLWRSAVDSGGEIDVAALEVPQSLLPDGAVLQAFDDSHLDPRGEHVDIGDPLTIAGFPLGFHDTCHHLAVARSASVASAYGVRFQQQGCFLTDARTHRGSSGSPVLRRRLRSRGWQLLGVHSTRMDMRPRDHAQDESLGLNCAWYADVLTTLTRTS